MNVDQKANVIRELESKLNEFDEILAQLGSASKVITPLFAKHVNAGARITNRSREMKDISQQLSVLKKVFSDYPGALSAISDITKTLNKLALQIDSLLNQV